MPNKSKRKASSKPKSKQSSSFNFIRSKVFWAVFLLTLAGVIFYAYLNLNNAPLSLYSLGTSTGGNTLNANFSPNCLWGGNNKNPNWITNVTACKGKSGTQSSASVTLPTNVSNKPVLASFTIYGMNADGRQIWVFVNGKRTVVKGKEKSFALKSSAYSKNEVVGGVGPEGSYKVQVQLNAKPDKSKKVTVKVVSPSNKNSKLTGGFLGDSVMLSPVVFTYTTTTVPSVCADQNFFGLNQFSSAKNQGQAPYFSVNQTDLVMPLGSTSAKVLFNEVGRVDYFKVAHRTGNSSWTYDRQAFNVSSGKQFDVDFSRVYSANGSIDYAIFAFNSGGSCSYGVPIILSTSTSLPQSGEPANPNSDRNRINPGSLNY